jgi:hypothetical protein
MKKNQIALIIILIMLFNLGCQTNKNKEKSNKNQASIKYEGVYTYGDDPDNGAVGSIIIYPESEDSYLFYIELSRGAPSYNMGSLYDRITIKSNKGVYQAKNEENAIKCDFSIEFSGDKLTITTQNGAYDCGFGANVIVDGEYYKVKDANFDHFVDLERIEYHFNQTKPEDYNKM